MPSDFSFFRASNFRYKKQAGQSTVTQNSGLSADTLAESHLFYSLLSRTLRVSCNVLGRVCHICHVPFSDLASGSSFLAALIHQDPSHLSDAHTPQEEIHSSQSNGELLVSIRNKVARLGLFVQHISWFNDKTPASPNYPGSCESDVLCER